MRLMILGGIFIVVGLVMMYAFYNLVDIGLVVCIVGIFFVLCGAFTPKVEAEEPVLTVEPREIPKPNPVKEIPLPSDDFSVTDESEIELLARLITAEAGYSSSYDPLDYEELCYLTGSVVINRIKSEKFPDTLQEVINQRGQYQCVTNGHINREYDDTAWEISEELLLYGTEIDEAVVFQSEFRQGSGIYRQIGNQYFCYE